MATNEREREYTSTERGVGIVAGIAYALIHGFLAFMLLLLGVGFVLAAF